MGIVPRVQPKFSHTLHAQRRKKLLQNPYKVVNATMERAMTKFRGAREKGTMAFAEFLGVSQEDPMEGSLWRESLGRSLESHDAA